MTIFLRLFKALHYSVCVALFTCAWFLFLRHFGIYVAPRYNVFVTGLFAVMLLYFLRLYNVYLIEYQSLKELCFSLGLAEFLSLLVTVAGIFIAWSNHKYNLWIFIFCYLFMVLFNCIWAEGAIRLYYTLSRPLRTCVIYQTNADRIRLLEVEKFDRKFIITDRIEAPQSLSEITDRLSGMIGGKTSGPGSGSMPEPGVSYTPDYVQSNFSKPGNDFTDRIEAVFVSGLASDLRNELIKYCAENQIQGFFLPKISDILLYCSHPIQAFSIPVMGMRKIDHPAEFFIVKRALDIVVSFLGIVVLSPLMLIVALAIHLGDNGPVLYRQVRLTKNGQKFEILKFRSMRIDAEKDGVARLSTGENDDRITPVGRILRKYRMDELPQLFNILKGDMTLVGPRPERPEIAAEYEKGLPEFSLRLNVKAGLTCYAQVYGKYCTDPYDKLKMDLLYINNMGFLEDLKLIFATIRILFVAESTKGVEEGHENAKIE